MSTIATAAEPADLPAGWLPRAGSVLVVLARPGQESAELGGLLYAFRRAGADLALLCLTRGEASAVNFTGSARLEAVRPWELQLAASVLGISHVTVASYPDGDLGRQPEAELRDRIGRAIREHAADLLLVIDPAAGDADDDGSAMDDAVMDMDDAAMDDAAVAAVACTAARRAGVPVLARTGPPGRVPGAWVIDLGPDAGTARIIQKAAVAAHESQSPALPELIRRLDRLDGREHLRWLVTPAWARRTPERQEKTCPTTRPRPNAGTPKKPPTPLTSLPWRRADTSW
jgi:LmbE family N-acetylglucosaminyl deacetylase